MTRGNALAHAGAGAGKALANGTKVKTPKGSINIEDLNIGDDVFGVDGSVYKVQGVYPQGEKEVWKVGFSNGTVIDCCEDHLWTWQTASRRSKGGKWDTDTIKHIHENVKLKTPSGKGLRSNVYLPITEPVKYSKKELPINPYLLGVILGDGGISDRSGVRFTNGEDDIIEKVESLLNDYGYTLSQMSRKNNDGNYNMIQIDRNEAIGNGNRSRLRKALEELNLFGSNSLEKFVPKVYMESDISDRINLLAGLIDTDGYRAKSYYEYSTSSKDLANDVSELCASLGLTAKISIKENPTYRYKGEILNGNRSYRIAIKESDRFPKLHTSKNHESRWKKGQSKSRITMRSITPTTELKNMTCISVSSPDSLFLIDGYIATHNTSAFTARVANLIGNEGVNPSEILGLTFTNEAAGNMRSRLISLIGKNKAEEVNLLTFHSFAYRLLKSRYSNEYSNKTIMKSWWKMQQLYDIVERPKSSGDIGLSLACKAGELGSFISFQKTNMVRGGDPIVWKDEFDIYGTQGDLQKAFDTYCQLVKNARLIDFDDMLVDLYYKLIEDDSLIPELKNDYKFVMVDEFQDTNSVSLAILKLITDNNLFVVGDFRQGIYGFINANVENILDFSETFDDVTVIELNDNFRSTDNIVNFANTVIEKSPIEKYTQFDSQIAARGVDGAPVSIKLYSTEYVEAKNTIEEIEEFHRNGVPYEDFAILTRTNAQIGFYESMFADENIPVDVSSSKSFFDRKEIADILSYAEHTVHPKDDMSMIRVINAPSRYISKAVTHSISEYAYNNNLTFEEASTAQNNGYATTNLSKLVGLFKDFRDDSETMTASVFLKNVYNKTGYNRHIEKTSSTSSDLAMKKDAIKRLFEIAKKFPSISAFLVHVSIIKSNSGKNKDGVKLMTVHASKGLEFEHVYVPAVTDENFPHEMNSDIEEERRLFYVASSRAMNHMTISLPIFTNDGAETFEPSPFLTDVMGDELLRKRKSILQRHSFSEMKFGLSDVA